MHKVRTEKAVLDMSSDDHATQDHFGEAIAHLMAASEAAKRIPDQDMLVRLIDAVLLHAGREFALSLEKSDPAQPREI